MIKIIMVPMNFTAQEEKFKTYGVSRENLISVTPLIDSSGCLMAIVTFDEVEEENA